MRILVLGASSIVGRALAEEFAGGNTLVLTGRDARRLALTESSCRQAGAVEAQSVVLDLSLGAGPLLDGIGARTLDLIIDAASASSATRDDDLTAGDLPAFVSADVLAKTALLEGLLKRQGTAPAVILVSSVLARVRSPGRGVYASLKTLEEAYLRRMKAGRPDMRLLVVYVGTLIDRDRGSEKARTLAKAAARAFKGGRTVLFHGVGGLFYVGLFHVQPLLFLAFASLQRRLRRRP